MKKITQKLTKSIWQSGLFALAFLFSLTINSQDLALQGIIDFTVPTAGNNGKAIHVLATADIADLSVYGIGVANNGGGTDGQEYTFPAVSVSAGDHIMVARTPADMAAYLGATEANIMLANTSISQNGDDAIELYFNDAVVETFGDIAVDGSGEAWEYQDSFAYKVDGAWTYGGVDCTDGSDTSATSSCPYPYTGVYTTGTAVVDTGCGGSATYTYGNNESGILYTYTNPDGGAIAVTVTGQTETGYDFLIVTDGSGTELYNASGDHTGQVITSTDGVINVAISSDGSWSPGGDGQGNGTEMTFTASCPVESFNITFSVNTANITVGENGMYLGGGVFGGSNAHLMTDDGTGTWTVTVAVDAGTTGNYIFLNSPANDADWGTKENLAGQSCGDAANYNDRTLPAITADATLLHCFGSCETDGTCATPTFNVTFSVNTANIEVGANGMYAGGGVLGDAMALALTDDGTGTWSGTVALNEGTAGNYTFLNSPNDGGDWGAKENLEGQECADAANYNDRILAAVTADTTLLHCFASCETDGTCPSPADTYATTFTVNVTDGYVDYDGNTQAIGDNIVYLNGNFNGWCGACNPMTDNGDGTWSSTVELEAGAYEYKFTVNGWDGAQEEWTADFAATEEGSCLITDGTYTNRALTVTDSAQTLSTVSWNSCTDATTGGDGCEYTIRLEDTYGDSWNGNTMDVLVNGVVVLDGVTITADDNEGDFNVFTLAVNEGDVITTFSYNEGTYVTETQYFIYNIDGSLVGSSYDGAVMQPESITVTCIVPEPGISITGITDGSTIGFGATTATFGVAVEGFSVTDDGSGDGHWHYSIDGGSAVMVYDLNDVTIDVVEGATHTILAWLVDDSHNAFDPSVESSVTFTVPSSTVGCGDEFYYDYTNGEGADALFTATNPDGAISLTITGQIEGNYDSITVQDGAGNVLVDAYTPADTATDIIDLETITSEDGTIVVYIISDSSVDGSTFADPIYFSLACANTELAAFLASGPWRSEAEMEGHIGVGPNGNNNSEWWNAAPWDKWQTGLYDDRWLFDNGAVFVDTGDDGAIFGKKPEIDVAFPAGDPDTAVNANNEYDYYIQDDYTDTFTLSATGAEVETVTFATIGNIGFYTSLPGQEFQILERTETTMYVRNVGSETNAWYNKLTTADALSTVDAMVLDMRIYPNPSNGSFVTIQTPVNGVKYVEVFDITGKRLMNTSLSANTLDVSSMSAGMYLVKVTIEGQSKTSKLIIR